MLFSRSNMREMQSPTPILILTIEVDFDGELLTSDDSSSRSYCGEDDEMQIVWAKVGRGIWGLGHVFEAKLYFTKYIVDDNFVPRNISKKFPRSFQTFPNVSKKFPEVSKKFPNVSKRFQDVSKHFQRFPRSFQTFPTVSKTFPNVCRSFQEVSNRKPKPIPKPEAKLAPKPAPQGKHVQLFKMRRKIGNGLYSIAPDAPGGQ